MTPSTETMQKTTQGIMQTCDALSCFARDSMDAALKSATVISKGFEETTRSTGSMVQDSIARAITAGKSMMGAKDLQEAVNMQNEFMKDCFDCWMTGTGRITEISARVTKEAIEPVAKHANDAMSKMMQKAS